MAVTKEILTLAVETGDALLRNGAEVYRVEDTVLHILKAYEITDCDVYVLSNGIFASANENKDDACSMIRHVPLGSTHLGRIAALNQLSREICSHECSLRDAWVCVWSAVNQSRPTKIASKFSSAGWEVHVFVICSVEPYWMPLLHFSSVLLCSFFSFCHTGIWNQNLLQIFSEAGL